MSENLRGIFWLTLYMQREGGRSGMIWRGIMVFYCVFCCIRWWRSVPSSRHLHLLPPQAMKPRRDGHEMKLQTHRATGRLTYQMSQLSHEDDTDSVGGRSASDLGWWSGGRANNGDAARCRVDSALSYVQWRDEHRTGPGYGVKIAAEIEQFGAGPTLIRY